MKKILSLLIGSFILVSLISCTDTKDTSNNSSLSSASASSLDNTSSLEGTHYHVIFINYNDEVLYQTDVLEGHEAVYSGATPTKPDDDEFTYEFKGWDKDLSSITENVTTKAEYNYTAKEHWGPLIRY